MKLLIDIGNSRIKWALYEATIERQHGSASHTERELLQHAWQTLPSPESIIAANVAGPTLGTTLSRWTEKLWQKEITFITPQAQEYGVTNTYQNPQQLGTDRWLALIAARHISTEALCIIDCGSAITLDLLTRSGDYLGGLILPGLQMMRNSLQLDTHAIALDTTTPSIRQQPCAGKNTHQGVINGTLYATVGAIERCVSELDPEKKYRCLITGGDAPTLLPLLQGGYQHEPRLVMQGLQIIAGHKT